MTSSWGIVSPSKPALQAAMADPSVDEVEDVYDEPPAPEYPNPNLMTDEELRAALKNPRWRLRNLYRIKDKEGRDVPFRPNEVQEKFLDEMWYRNLVPKARQRGFTTLIQILMLDFALFQSNFAGAVIAQDMPTVLRIFREKIKYAYDRLPKLVRGMVRIVKNNQSELIFSNGSSIYVAVSTRGGTLQMLHISELGQISKKYPEKATEIQTGSLPAVDAGGIIIIESTIESAAGMFPDMLRRALMHQQMGLKLSRMQYRLHFASWWDAKEYEADPEGVVMASTDLAYFERMEAAIGRPLSRRKRAWYVLKRDEEFAGNWEKMKSQYPTIIDEGFEVSQDGLWLGQQMAQARVQGRIRELPFDPSKPVHFFWDLGRSDNNAVWCGQEDGPWMNWLAFYTSTGEPYAFLVNKIRAENPRWTWGKTWLPHDGEQRQAGAHVLRNHFDLFEELGVPNLDKVDRVDAIGNGIEELRAAMSLYRFDAVGCAEGILCLDGYAKQWNDRMGMWTSLVLKNGCQHGADALRQHAQIRHELMKGMKPKTGKKKKRAGAMTA